MMRAYPIFVEYVGTPSQCIYVRGNKGIARLYLAPVITVMYDFSLDWGEGGFLLYRKAEVSTGMDPGASVVAEGGN